MTSNPVRRSEARLIVFTQLFWPGVRPSAELEFRLTPTSYGQIFGDKGRKLLSSQPLPEAIDEYCRRVTRATGSIIDEIVRKAATRPRGFDQVAVAELRARGHYFGSIQLSAYTAAGRTVGLQINQRRVSSEETLPTFARRLRELILNVGDR